MADSDALPHQSQRSAMFAYSDIHSAADDFVNVVAQFADPMWEADDISELADSLTERALRVLNDEGAGFDG